VPFHVPHMYWHCMATGLAVEFPIHIKALFDHGSHAVPISEAFATHLGLRHHSLPRPETVELAMKMDKKKVQIQLHEWVKICLSDPASLISESHCCPRFMFPIILSLPFLSHNTIVIDHAAHTAIDKSCDFDLLNSPPPVAPPAPKMKLKDLFQHVKQARKLMVAELKWVLSVCQWEWPSIDDPVKPVNIVAAVRECIESLAAGEKLHSLEKEIMNEFADMFTPIPHLDQLPTDVYCHIKLKDSSKTIATHSYSTL
jgi:hypothetical protein